MEPLNGDEDLEPYAVPRKVGYRDDFRACRASVSFGSHVHGIEYLENFRSEFDQAINTWEGMYSRNVRAVYVDPELRDQQIYMMALRRDKANMDVHGIMVVSHNTPGFGPWTLHIDMTTA